MSSELAILTPRSIDRAAQSRALEVVGGLTITGVDGANVSAGLPGGTEVIDAPSRRAVPHCVTLFSDPSSAAPSPWDLSTHGIATDASLVETTVQIETGTDDEFDRIIRATAHLAREHNGVLIDPEDGLLIHADGTEHVLTELGEERPTADIAADACEDTAVVQFTWYGLLDDAGGEMPDELVRRGVRDVVGSSGLGLTTSVVAARFWTASCTLRDADVVADVARARRLLGALADATRAFAAHAQPLTGVTIEKATPWYGPEASAQSLSTLRQDGGWHGLSPRPLWLLWLGEPYADVRIKGQPVHIEQTGSGRLVQSTALPQEALHTKKPMRRHLSRWLFALVLPHAPNVLPPPLLAAWSLPEVLESR